LFKFPPLGAKKPANAATISTEIPLLKDEFQLQTLFTLFKERYAVMTPANFFQRPL